MAYEMGWGKKFFRITCMIGSGDCKQTVRNLSDGYTGQNNGTRVGIRITMLCITVMCHISVNRK